MSGSTETRTAPPADHPETFRPYAGQRAFLECPAFEALAEGPRGGGKTLTLIVDFLRDVGCGFGFAWAGILFRQTFPQLRDVRAKTLEWIPRFWPAATFNKAESVWTWPSGESLRLAYIRTDDDYWNYHGHEYPWIGFEELTTWPSLDVYRRMFSCCRSATPGLPCRVRSTTNPYGPGHNAVKDRFRLPVFHGEHLGEVIRTPGEPDRVAVRITLQENRALQEADPGYEDRIRAAASNPSERAAWLDGSWDITSGGIIDDLWRPATHVVRRFDVPRAWRIDRALDWGSSKPYSVGWYAESNGDPYFVDGLAYPTLPGDVFRVHELYGWTGKANTGRKQTAKEVALEIREVEAAVFPDRRVDPGPADSNIYDAAHDGKSVASDMSAMGVDWKRAEKGPGSRINGWERLRTMLREAMPRDGEPREEPGFFVVESCAQWLRTVPSLPRSSKNPDDADCWVAGTMIETEDGPRPIEEIRPGDLVWTPVGLRRVRVSHLSGASSTVRVMLSDGREIEGTPDHPVLVYGVGMVEIGKLEFGSTLIQKFSPWSSVEYSEVVSFASTMGVATSSARSATPLRERRSFTVSYGPSHIGEHGPDRQRARRSYGETPPRCSSTPPRGGLRAAIVARLLSLSTSHRSTATTKGCSRSHVPSVARPSYASHTGRGRSKPAPTSVVGLCVVETPQPVYSLTVEEAGLYFVGGIVSGNTDAEDHCSDETRYRLYHGPRTSGVRAVQGR